MRQRNLSSFVKNNSPFFTKIKSIDQTKNSDSTFALDSELFFSPKPNKKYFLELLLFYKSEAIPDIKVKIIIPTGATGTRINDFWQGDDAQPTTDFTTELVMSGTGNILVLAWFGFITTDSSNQDSDIGLSWAQNTSDIADTTILGGSFLRVNET